jgi:hypothetical protein
LSLPSFFQIFFSSAYSITSSIVLSFIPERVSIAIKDEGKDRKDREEYHDLCGLGGFMVLQPVAVAGQKPPAPPEPEMSSWLG